MIFTEPNFHPSVRDTDFKRFLRFPPKRRLEGALAENAAWARAWFARHARPWFCALAVETEIDLERGLAIDGELFGTAALARKLAGIGRAAVLVASAGVEAEKEAAARWRAGEPDRYFFLECYAAAVADALVHAAHRRLQIGAGASRLSSSRHGPGYAGWPMAEAARLLARIATAAGLPGVLEALPSGMLRPKKSHVVLVGLESACLPATR